MSILGKVSKALDVLGIEDYILRSDSIIDTEEKFNNAFRKVTGKDENENAIEESDPSKFGVTWSQVKTEMDKL
tara:strand:+ start:442 stop:660 length:219 start_codon:yes stop_codon:yes gene_type:complete